MSESELEWYSVPHLLHIEMTYSCNSKCFFCYNPYRNSPINYSMIDKLVKSVAKSQVPHVYLIGGEPSLLRVEELNKYIKKLSPVSSITIVTNGLVYMQGLDREVACIGIALHGNKETQEWLSGIKGGYERTIETISKYVVDGFDVRCIPVLTSKNFDQMYNIIKLAKEMGMESVFVDKFEIGGMGLDMANQLKPSLEQFKIALGQMIAARDDFSIPVGFGTAIPYCLDERLIKEDMTANCGVGSTFCAVDPNGNLRICNQSEIVYGNILKEPVEQIWNKKEINEFRNLKWADEPCKNCSLLGECTGGCKVDLSCSNKYCIDYHMRENKGKTLSVKRITELWKERNKSKGEEIRELFVPKEYRDFLIDRFLKLNTKHSENYIVTRYQTVIIDDITVKVVKKILDGEVKEENLIKIFSKELDETEVRKLLSKLELVGAIHSKLIRSIDLEITRNCNLKCSQCINGQKIIKDEIPFPVLIRALGRLCENGLEEVSITGGEPFMYLRVFELIKYLHAKSVQVRILTNATLLTSKKCKEIKNLVSEIGISVDGINAKSNDYVRGKGTFNLIMKAVENLRKYEIPFSFYSCLHRKNTNISDLIEFSKKQGAIYLKVNEITKRGNAAINYDQRYKVDTKVLNGIHFNRDKSKCTLQRDHLFIDRYGDCYPCVEIAQRNVKPIGNFIQDEPVKLFEKLKTFILRNSGRNCPYTLLDDKYCKICLNNNYKCNAK
jgi:radical SAM protein with 4Fe4S-binding SPASM domain